MNLTTQVCAERIHKAKLLYFLSALLHLLHHGCLLKKLQKKDSHRKEHCLFTADSCVFCCCSFTWSSEKIDLNMIQLITGHLVRSFDEEFRTLYARSSVPAELCPLDGSFPQMLASSAKKVEPVNRLLGEERNEIGPLIKNEICVHTPLSGFLSAAPVDLKRHSYAGEIHDGYTQQNIWPRGSNWNIYQETGYAANKYLMTNNVCLPQRSRGQNAHPFSHGEQTVTLLPTPPTLENTSKSHMRTLRIESYLQTNDDPFRDSCDYLEEYEQLDKSSRMMPGRIRSSLVFKPSIQEQMELNRQMSYSGLRPSAAPHTPLQYSSMHWNPTMAETQMSNEEFLLKRKSLQILDNRNGATYGQGRNMYPCGYASLGRAKGRPTLANADILMENWHKRCSMAEPRSNAEPGQGFSGNMCEDFERKRAHRSSTGLNAQNGQYNPNLNEEQRSISHYDVKGITNSPDIWQDPPSRTVSAAALHPKNTDFIPTSSIATLQRGLQQSSKKIKSLLNVPEQKEEAGKAETYSSRSASSTGTITAEEETRGRAPNLSKSLSLSLKQQAKWHDGDRSKSCKAQVATEEGRGPKHHIDYNKNTRTGLGTGSWRTERSRDDKYEPYSAEENSHSVCAEHENNSKSPTEGGSEVELKFSARGHRENKLGRLFQRVGNLLHKKK